MLYTCVQKFDVTGTVEIFLKTKQGLNIFWNVHKLILGTESHRWNDWCIMNFKKQYARIKSYCFRNKSY